MVHAMRSFSVNICFHIHSQAHNHPQFQRLNILITQEKQRINLTRGKWPNPLLLLATRGQHSSIVLHD
uniref:Uncharacterized protein n=1 Tax=Anguilla anguilla TaxID=7936 RepID=A0A0E9WWD9_ANGAN